MIASTIALAFKLAVEGAPLQQPTFTPSANPVSDAARARMAREPKHLIAAAELLPADK
ncbi:MAG TPA: hypothetical protein VFT47_16225 [Vicinamibacterales bacterium]|nr:hypothetical protein [Vicinamibacterales bacterium]